MVCVIGMVVIGVVRMIVIRVIVIRVIMVVVMIRVIMSIRCLLRDNWRDVAEGGNGKSQREQEIAFHEADKLAV